MCRIVLNSKTIIFGRSITDRDIVAIVLGKIKSAFYFVIQCFISRNIPIIYRVFYTNLFNKEGIKNVVSDGDIF